MKAGAALHRRSRSPTKTVTFQQQDSEAQTVKEEKESDQSTENQTFITYNAGLYEGVGFGAVPNPPSREARRAAIISELLKPGNEADLVCLQEVWFGEDVKAIMDGVWSVYRYSYSPLHHPDGVLAGEVFLDGLDRTPACGRGFSQAIYFSVFLRCYESNCDGSGSIDEAVSCLASNCLLQYIVLSQECIQCVITTAPDVDEVREKCSRPVSRFPLRYRNMNIPDVMLLSKTTISEPSFTDFHPRTKEYTGLYGYIQAQVFGIGQVACTHATPYGSAGLSLYPEIQLRLFEGIRSYEEQGAAQLTQFVTQFGSTSPLFILGDFNVGAAVEPDINATQLANYEIMTSAFQTVQLDQCTICASPENPYNGDTMPEVIDHIFYQGWTYTPGSSVRVFDDVTVEGLPLSDHFGVKQTFS